MKAWQRVRAITDNAIPVVLAEEEQTWLYANEVEKATDFTVKLMWSSHAPGSYAPESIMIAAVQAKENRGYIVADAERLIAEGLEAYEANDLLSLNRISAELWHQIHNAKKDEQSEYWSYTQYHSFEEYRQKVSFVPKKELAYKEDELFERTYAGWLGQIIGGAFGTAMEGYTTANIYQHLGEVNSYIRKPNTYNDDITFEIAFLEAYKKYGKEITAKDIALSWIAYIPSAWSAEDIALRNIRYGVFPPESGSWQNPFSEWIGAQMRGAICGMIAYGNPEEAARLAWLDGSVSHHNNGILGEVFNAIIVSLSYVERDMKEILKQTIAMIPTDSEYYYFINHAYQLCLASDDWRTVWQQCEEICQRYNWIHAYPNAMAEIVALYFGDNDFDKTMMIIGMCGQDVDCNAAQIMTAVAIMNGLASIAEKWSEPIGDRLDTYLRVKKELSIKQLARETVDVMLKN